MPRILAVVLALAAAAVVALLANLVLLGYATNGNDPVGRLSPRDGVITAPPARTRVRTVTTSTTTTPTGRRGRDHAEDD
jgi:hypothetical protein